MQDSLRTGNEILLIGSHVLGQCHRIVSIQQCHAASIPCQLVGRQASATVTFQTSNSKAASASWSCKHGSPNPFQLSAGGCPLEIEPRPLLAGAPCPAPVCPHLHPRPALPRRRRPTQHARRWLAAALKKTAGPFGAARELSIRISSRRGRPISGAVLRATSHTEQAAKQAKRTKLTGRSKAPGTGS
jgi:hypothetical protein